MYHKFFIGFFIAAFVCGILFLCGATAEAGVLGSFPNIQCAAPTGISFIGLKSTAAHNSRIVYFCQHPSFWNFPTRGIFYGKYPPNPGVMDWIVRFREDVSGRHCAV